MATRSHAKVCSRDKLGDTHNPNLQKRNRIFDCTTKANVLLLHHLTAVRAQVVENLGNAHHRLDNGYGAAAAWRTTAAAPTAEKTLRACQPYWAGIVGVFERRQN
jgi:hypothetical protein